MASEALNRICPDEVWEGIKTAFAVKSCPASASSMNIERQSLNVCVTTSVIVKSAFATFSTILLASPESEALIFSPTAKVPTTVVRTTLPEPVPEANTYPVAAEVTPVT